MDRLMFASPSFEASPPAAADTARNDDDNDEEVVAAEEQQQLDTASFDSPSEEYQVDDDDAVVDDDGDDDDDDEIVAVPEGQEEDRDDDDDDEDVDDEDDEDDDDDDVASPDTGGTPTADARASTATTTTPAFPVPPPPAQMGMAGTHLMIRAVPHIKLGPQYREIGKEALCWQLSSAKPGNGVEQIRDSSTDTYWQSDGLKQPHWIQVHFARRVALSHVCLYLDYSLDESYTPKRVSVHHGMTSQDLQAATADIEFAEPNGWCIIPLHAPPDPLDVYHDTAVVVGTTNSIRAHLLRISILAMHQNGRDTHIRQVELYGPRRPQGPPALLPSRPAEHNANDNSAVVVDQDLTLPAWSPRMSWGLGGVVR